MPIEQGNEPFFPAIPLSPGLIIEIGMVITIEKKEKMQKIMEMYYLELLNLHKKG